MGSPQHDIGKTPATAGITTPLGQGDEVLVPAPFGRWAWLTPVLLAAGVNVLFGASYFLAIDCRFAPSGGNPPCGMQAPSLTLTPASLADLTSRLYWVGTLVLMMIALGVACWIALRIVFDSWWRPGTGRRASAIGGMAVVLMAATYAWYVSRSPLPLVDWFGRATTPAFTPGVSLRVIRLFLYALTTALLASAAGVVVSSCREHPRGLRDMASAFARLEALLVSGAAVLVAYVLESTAIFGWATAYAREADRPAIAGVVSAYGTMIGTTYSLTLAAVCVPALLYVRRHASVLARTTLAREGTLSPTPAAERKWMDEQGLAWSLPKMLGNGFAILSPVLASTPAAAIVSAFAP